MAMAVNTDWVNSLFPNGTAPAATKFDPVTGVILEMLGFRSAGGHNVAYDSYLLLHHGLQNHTLTLALKINLNPMLPELLPKATRVPIFDADTPPKMFMIRPWQRSEWAKFTGGFRRECLKWNDRFWLIPPAGFSKLDIKQGHRTVRPNIYCHLYVAVVGSVAGAHRSISVVNLDLQDAKTRLGLSNANLNSGAFRSDSNRYDSLDIKNREQQSQDDLGQWHKVKKYSTIVHEIGHALGLPHIGVTHKDPVCQLAIFFKQFSPDPSSLPALFTGGSNSSPCYGNLGVPSRGANVMGGGTSFEESNAAPWVSRVAMHTGTKPEDWLVSRSHVAPKHI